jgi:hypothetical protein
MVNHTLAATSAKMVRTNKQQYCFAFAETMIYRNCRVVSITFILMEVFSATGAVFLLQYAA